MTFHPARPYSAEEDAIIHERAGRVSWPALAAALSGRTPDSVKNRAATLGLFNTGGGESAAHEAAVRSATIHLGHRIREVARRRGVALPISTYRERAGA